MYTVPTALPGPADYGENGAALMQLIARKEKDDYLGEEPKSTDIRICIYTHIHYIHIYGRFRSAYMG
jgi:hypothetical protein